MANNVVDLETARKAVEAKRLAEIRKKLIQELLEYGC